MRIYKMLLRIYKNFILYYKTKRKKNYDQNQALNQILAYPTNNQIVNLN